MRAVRIIASGLLVALSGGLLHAYETPVHREISGHAFDRLTLDFQARLGVDRTHSVKGKTLRQLMGDGAVDEDDFPRPVNHFFDPAHGAALTTKFPVWLLHCQRNRQSCLGYRRVWTKWISIKSIYPPCGPGLLPNGRGGSCEY